MKYLLIILLFSSCTYYKYGYGKARLTIVNGKHHLQRLEKMKPLKDTTMEIILIGKLQ